ncbi:MAG: helix-turn-helix domain-containing protein [Pseudonocardia sp.]
MQIDPTRMYRVSTVAEMLDVSASTVYRAIEAGALPALRIGSTVRVSGAALSAWLTDAARGEATPAAASGATS